MTQIEQTSSRKFTISFGPQHPAAFGRLVVACTCLMVMSFVSIAAASQGNTMERRMAEMALRAKTDHILADTVSYQEATDCTAVYMGNQASFLDGGLAEIQAYARNVATWQSMRMRRAEKESVEVKGLSADNYCDTITINCNSKKQVKKLLNACAKKVRKAEKAAKKKLKAAK